MTLKKGFLRPELKLPNKKKLFLASVISLSLGAILYLFLYELREVAITFSNVLAVAPWDRTTEEFNQSNLLLAFFAMCSALAIFIGLLSKQLTIHLPQRKRYNMLVYLVVLIPSLLSLMLRYGFIEHLFLHTSFVNFEPVKRVRNTVPLILALAILVIFLNNWIELVRIYKRKIYKWMLISLLSVCSLSYALSFVQPFPKQLAESTFYDPYLIFNYDIDLPQIIYKRGWIRGPSFRRVHVFFEKKDSSKLYPKILFDDQFGKVSDLADYHSISCQPISSSFMSPIIGIDKDVPMSFVDSIKNELSLISPTAYFLVNDGSNLYADYNSNRAIEINLMFRRYSNPNIKNLPPTPPCIENRDNDELSFLCQISNDGSYLINGTKIDSSILKETIKPLLQKKVNNEIRIDVSPQAIFNSYAYLIGNIYQARLELTSEAQNKKEVWMANLNTFEYRIRIIEQ